MIKGLRPQLGIAGRIKIGGLGELRKSKSGGAYRLPQKFDSIHITTNVRGPDLANGVRGDLLPDEELMAVLGKVDDHTGEVRVTEVPIILHSDSIDEVFPTELAWYQSNRAVCRGDGEDATRFEIKDGKLTGASKPWQCFGCPENPLAQSGGSGRCKPHATLYCSIGVPGRAVAGALHVWRTTSIISINRMIGSLQQILSITGVLQGLPLWLVLQPVDTANGKVFVMHCELRAKDVLEAQRTALDVAKMRAQNARQLEAFNSSYRALVRAPVSMDDSEESIAETNMEFSPETARPVAVDDVRVDSGVVDGGEADIAQSNEAKKVSKIDALKSELASHG